MILIGTATSDRLGIRKVLRLECDKRVSENWWECSTTFTVVLVVNGFVSRRIEGMTREQATERFNLAIWQEQLAVTCGLCRYQNKVCSECYLVKGSTPFGGEIDDSSERI